MIDRLWFVGGCGLYCINVCCLEFGAMCVYVLCVACCLMLMRFCVVDVVNVAFCSLGLSAVVCCCCS